MALLFFYFIDLSIKIEAKNHFTHKEVVGVSLGYNCIAADQLQRSQIRAYAYPFDWVITPWESLYKALNNWFKDFLLRENLMPHGRHLVMDRLYNIDYWHDFDWQYLGDFSFETMHNFLDKQGNRYPQGIDKLLDIYFPEVKEKYNRRVDRFKALSQHNDPVLFLRVFEVTREQAIMLRNILVARFPRMKFVLVVVNNTEDFKVDWGVKRIKNFYMPQDLSWDEMEQSYFKDIFNKVLASLGR